MVSGFLSAVILLFVPNYETIWCLCLDLFNSEMIAGAEHVKLHWSCKCVSMCVVVVVYVGPVVCLVYSASSRNLQEHT